MPGGTSSRACGRLSAARTGSPSGDWRRLSDDVLGWTEVWVSPPVDTGMDVLVRCCAGEWRPPPLATPACPLSAARGAAAVPPGVERKARSASASAGAAPSVFTPAAPDGALSPGDGPACPCRWCWCWMSEDVRLMALSWRDRRAAWWPATAREALTTAARSTAKSANLMGAGVVSSWAARAWSRGLGLGFAGCLGAGGFLGARRLEGFEGCGGKLRCFVRCVIQTVRWIALPRSKLDYGYSSSGYIQLQDIL
jgi:hypothetical protein